MRVRSLDFTAFVALLGLGLAACGGSQDKPPGPLGRHFDESFIAQISLDEKKSVIAAQNEYGIAKMEEAKAQADEREARTMYDVARNELGSARLDEKSANQRKTAADQSADQNRINDATKEQRGAELARRAAEQRLAYLDAYMKWLHVLLRFTQENTYWRESQLELAEANLAKAKNIQPKGFNPADYENQEAQRRSRTNAAKGKADAAKARALEARTTWLAIQSEADKTLGKKSDFPDPMAPHEKIEGTDKTAGGGGYTLGQDGSNTTDSHVAPADDPTKHQTPPPPPPAPQNNDDEDDGGESGGGSP